MARLPKCPYCDEYVQTNQPSKKYNNKTYHLNCYKKYCDEVYNNTSQADIDTKQELHNYICSLFNIKELNSMLISQLNNIFKENNFTYNGVLYSLKYFFEIKENKPDLNYGIGIVPFIYNDAKAFYNKRANLIKKYTDTKTDFVKKDPKSVPYVSQKNTNNYKMIDIEKL